MPLINSIDDLWRKFYLKLSVYQFKIIVPTPTLVGREKLYTTGFFVQSILADRYIHRRKL